jgi:hypothetical protein
MSHLQSPISFVWPYWKRSKPIESLHLSIDLALRNVPDIQPIVIGDNPQRNDVIHLDQPRISVGQFKKLYGERLKKQKPTDGILKLQRAIDSEIVSDPFFRIYDDTFILQPVTIEELSIQRQRGRVEPGETKLDGYHELRRQTFRELKNRNLTTYDFGTHNILRIEKEKARQTIRDFELLNNPLLFESCYGNQWLDNPQRIESRYFRFVSCENDIDVERLPKILTANNRAVEKILSLISSTHVV